MKELIEVEPVALARSALMMIRMKEQRDKPSDSSPVTCCQRYQVD